MSELYFEVKQLNSRNVIQEDRIRCMDTIIRNLFRVLMVMNQNDEVQNSDIELCNNIRKNGVTKILNKNIKNNSKKTSNTKKINLSKLIDI